MSQSATPNASVEALLNHFLRPLPGNNSPDAIKAKLRYWVERANHPEKHSSDPSPFAVADLRRKARQNVRRIVMRHPAIAAVLQAEEAQ